MAVRLVPLALAFALLAPALALATADVTSAPPEAAVRACQAAVAESAARAAPALPPNVTFERHVVTTDLGVALDVGVYRPANATGVPVVAIVSPYFGNRHPTIGHGLNDDATRIFEAVVPAGYAFAQASLAGTGCSTGCFSIGDRREWRDVAAVVDFLGALPWSNGKVALTGKSYEGSTPWMAAAARPAHLAAILPFEGLADQYRFVYRNGTTPANLDAAYPAYYPLMTDWALPLLEFYFEPGAKERYTVGAIDRAAPNAVHACAEEAKLLAGMLATTATGAHDAFWDERDAGTAAAGSTVPVLLGVGLADGNVEPRAALYAHDGMRGPRTLLIGHWDHRLPSLPGFDALLVRWLDRHLKGAANGVDGEPAVRYEVKGAGGGWRASATWPPTEAVTERLRLAPDGALASGPVPPGSVPVGRTPERPAGDAVFLAPPIERARVVAGIPRVHADLLVRAPGGQIVAELSVVGPSSVTFGTVSTVVNLAQAASVHEHDPALPGEVVRVHLEFNAVAVGLVPGDRLRLRLAPDSLAYAPTGASAFDVLLGGEHDANLEIQFVEGGA